MFPVLCSTTSYSRHSRNETADVIIIYSKDVLHSTFFWFLKGMKCTEDEPAQQNNPSAPSLQFPIILPRNPIIVCLIMQMTYISGTRN